MFRPRLFPRVIEMSHVIEIRLTELRRSRAGAHSRHFGLRSRANKPILTVRRGREGDCGTSRLLARIVCDNCYTVRECSLSSRGWPCVFYASAVDPTRPFQELWNPPSSVQWRTRWSEQKPRNIIPRHSREGILIAGLQRR